MIYTTRMTGNEREVLHAALKAYDTALASAGRASRARTVQDDVRWRRYIAQRLLEQVDGKVAP